MISGLDHCLTSNLTAVQSQCIVYTSEVSVSGGVGGGGGGGGEEGELA